MANLKQWLLECAGGEDIECVVIGQRDWSDEEPIPVKGKMLTWEHACRYIDYEFHEGYGLPECHSICAWTKTKVIAVSRYDGSTSPFVLPRNPEAHNPIMPGG